VPHSSSTGEIVVGVDGSTGSEAALAGALAESRLRGARLRVIHAYQIPALAFGDVGIGAPGTAARAAAVSEDIESVRSAAEEHAKSLAETALRRAGADAVRDLEIELDAVEGPAAQVLIEAGRGADLLVVGSRGHGGFVGLLLGSVSQQCAQHPPCPVVVHPAPPEEQA
jgi:nucleotide-binding universal stress UspA family protein